MKSLRELYRIGYGPSSSHTIGVQYACRMYLESNPDAVAFEVTLFASLALTGEGHGTNQVIFKTLAKPTEVILNTKDRDIKHPNTMDIVGILADGSKTQKTRFYSIGGGAVAVEGETLKEGREVYKHKDFASIKDYCRKNNMKLYEYVFEHEDEEFKNYLKEVWERMKEAVENGLGADGYLPGPLKVKRKAKDMYQQATKNLETYCDESREISAYALAVAEENAAGGIIVTAPTCGACGVVPACMYHMQEEQRCSDEQIVNALATAGLIGNVVKHNASISGAECGCQAEIGTACCMAAAALGELRNRTIDQIECAAEMAMENNLGLTCDPLMGYVQVPCIERNAIAALKALNSSSLAEVFVVERKITLDTVIKTMYQTGKDLQSKYRETAKGGLAKYYKKFLKGKL